MDWRERLRRADVGQAVSLLARSRDREHRRPGRDPLAIRAGRRLQHDCPHRSGHRRSRSWSGSRRVAMVIDVAVRTSDDPPRTRENRMMIESVQDRNKRAQLLLAFVLASNAVIVRAAEGLPLRSLDPPVLQCDRGPVPEDEPMNLDRRAPSRSGQVDERDARSYGYLVRP
jgi:hypothetical protein